MNTVNKPWIYIAIGILLIMSAILSAEALALQYERLNGEIGLNKLVIAPKYAGVQHVKGPIEAESLEKLRKKMGGHAVSLSASREAVAESEAHQAQPPCCSPERLKWEYTHGSLHQQKACLLTMLPAL